MSSVDSAQERLLKVYFSNACVSACPSFIIFFFFWCKESQKINDPMAELCSGDAKDEILTPPVLPTLL